MMKSITIYPLLKNHMKITSCSHALIYGHKTKQLRTGLVDSWTFGPMVWLLHHDKLHLLRTHCIQRYLNLVNDWTSGKHTAVTVVPLSRPFISTNSHIRALFCKFKEHITKQGLNLWTRGLEPWTVFFPDFDKLQKKCRRTGYEFVLIFVLRTMLHCCAVPERKILYIFSEPLPYLIFIRWGKVFSLLACFFDFWVSLSYDIIDLDFQWK